MSSQTDGAATGIAPVAGAHRREPHRARSRRRSCSAARRSTPTASRSSTASVRRTYAELRERVNRLASALRARGLERHDRVAALCPNVPELLELHHAVPAAGGVLVAINMRLSADEIGYILEHSGARRAVRRPRARAAGGRGARRPRGRAARVTSTSGWSPPATRPASRRCCATRRSRSRSTTPRARPAARRASSTPTAART